MARASWKGRVIAESDETIVVDGNHYFPPEALVSEHFRKSDHRTSCGWKGEASYFDVKVDGEVNANAAWYYPAPKEQATELRGRVAFWRGVSVTT